MANSDTEAEWTGLRRQVAALLSLKLKPKTLY